MVSIQYPCLCLITRQPRANRHDERKLNYQPSATFKTSDVCGQADRTGLVAWTTYQPASPGHYSADGGVDNCSSPCIIYPQLLYGGYYVKMPEEESGDLITDIDRPMPDGEETPSAHPSVY